tara:strand:+ start:72 stop:326 length:255 start_codon:yes stop_codon:yes gene_type:complete
MTKKRDYKKEYVRYDSKRKRVKARVNRNKARRIMKKAGLAKVGDGKDVHHKDGNTKNNKRSNLAMQKATKNRSYKRTSKGKPKK